MTRGTARAVTLLAVICAVHKVVDGSQLVLASVVGSTVMGLTPLCDTHDGTREFTTNWWSEDHCSTTCVFVCVHTYNYRFSDMATDLLKLPSQMIFILLAYGPRALVSFLL